MNILFYSPFPNEKIWIQTVKKKFKGQKVLTIKDNPNYEKIDIVILFNLPNQIMKKLINLKIIFSLGAGVDHILKLKSYNRNIPIVRIKDPNMTSRMANHALSQILNFQLSLNTYRNAEKKKEWNKTEFTFLNKDMTVGILGLGYIGSFVANYLQKIDYNVIGFKNSKPKSKMSFPVYTKKNLDNFIKRSHIIISILPATNKTNNFIDLKFLKKMKKNSLLINIGRGNVLNEDDLLKFLKINKNFFVSLDVFKKEPLSKNHKFWNHPNITVTPHVAALTDIDSSINLIYKRFLLYKKTKKIISDVNFEKEY